MYPPIAGGDFKAQVLQAVNIVELISQTVALKRRGRDYVGLCPFHQEKTPSFHVKSERQFFYCFGCKAAGNAIDFVMKRDRVEFIDALKTLGQSVGLEMPRLAGANNAKAGERQALLEMQSAACGFFEKLLSHPEHGAAGRAYLEQRGFNAETIRRFQVGFAPDAWDGLLRSTVGRRFAPEQMVAGGLLKKREKGDGYYDAFRNRLMFPIRDENARIIAFGGRVMPGSQDPAKYLNSPETPLFSKSRCIFGLDLARQKIVETRTAVVVEGYTDVVMAHQFGAANVVSVLGTAMTEQHVQVLRRFADRIVLLFDADTAGDAAVDRAVGLFLTQPVEIAIASMPQGVDPDEYLLEHGTERFDQLIAAASDALAYKWKQLQTRFEASGDSLTAQQKAVEEYLQVLSSARGSGPVDSLRWGAAVARVSRLTGIPAEQLNRRFKAARPANRRPSERGPAQAPVGMEPTTAGGGGGPSTDAEANGSSPASRSRPTALTAQQRAERRLLGVLLVEPQRWMAVQKSIGIEDFTDERHRRLADVYWTHQRNEGVPVFNEFLGFLADPALVEVAVEAVEEVEALAASDVIVQDAVGFFREAKLLRESQKLEAELRRRSPEQDDALLLRKLQEQARHPNLRKGLL